MMGLPINKCPGVKASAPSSGRVSRAISGLLFSTDSTLHSTVLYSSKVKAWSLRSLRSGNFADLTPASHKPPKCGALLGS